MLSQGVCGPGTGKEKQVREMLDMSYRNREGWGRGSKVYYSVHTRPRVHPQNHANSTIHNHLGLMVGNKEECRGRKKEKQKVIRKSRIMKRMLASSALCLRLRYLTKFTAHVFIVVGVLFCFVLLR